MPGAPVLFHAMTGAAGRPPVSVAARSWALFWRESWMALSIPTMRGRDERQGR